jgi:hypothetical protein
VIRYPDGIPHWYANLVHRWYVRRCRRTGHTGRPTLGGACSYCGYLWYTDDT